MRSIKDSKGVSMLGVMVAVGISSLMILGMYQAIAKFVGIQAYKKAVEDADTVTGKIQLMLSSQNYCTQNFSGITIDSSTRAQPQDIGLRLRSVNQDLSMGEVLYEDNKQIRPNLSLQKFQLQADAPVGGPLFVGSLHLVFNFSQGSGNGPPVITREIPMSLELTAIAPMDAVAACRAGNEPLSDSSASSGRTPSGNTDHSSGANYGMCVVQGSREDAQVSNNGVRFLDPKDAASKHVSVAQFPFSICDAWYRREGDHGKVSDVACHEGYQLVRLDNGNNLEHRKQYSCQKI